MYIRIIIINHYRTLIHVLIRCITFLYLTVAMVYDLQHVQKLNFNIRNRKKNKQNIKLSTPTDKFNSGGHVLVNMK